MGPGLLLSRLAIFLLSTGSLLDAYSTNEEAYGADSDSPYQVFNSAPELKPPELLFTKELESQLANGSLFMFPYGTLDSNQTVPSIFDLNPGPTFGTLVWTGINYIDAWDFRTQNYKGEPHITFFLGKLLSGYGHGSFYILDSSYQEVARFDAVDYAGRGDLHEFVVTEDDHGLVLVYTPVEADLTQLNGTADGWIFENIIQEIDIETNELIWSWNATEHIALNETYDTIKDKLSDEIRGTEETPFDYFHINSADKDANEDYLVSARVMHCVYKISGKDGSIIWRLGGKLSDFDVEPEAEFAFAHDARWIDNKKQDQMTLFDNGPHGNVNYSRGLLLAVDQEAMTVRLLSEFKNPQETFNIFSGNMHAINPSDPDTNFFVGFGVQPYFGEFSSNGTILLNGQCAATNAVGGYRSFKLPWKGTPSEKPKISWDSSSGAVYTSWNGATEHQSWILYTADEMEAPTWDNISAPVERTGFETGFDISTANYSSLIRARAVDADGETLGWTDVADSDGNVRAATEPDDEQIASPEATSSSTSSDTDSAATASSTSTDSAAAALPAMKAWELMAIAVVMVACWKM